MPIQCFVTGDWFAHSRKITLEEQPSSLTQLLEFISHGLGERVAKLFYFEQAISFYVEVDQNCLSDIKDGCKLQAHRSVASQAAASRRRDNTANGDMFCAGAETAAPGMGGHANHDHDAVVDGATQGWSHYDRERSSVVTINVGGQLFTTSVETLTRFPESFLAGMFEGRFPVSRDAAGRVFIDRDPKVFKIILTYLRDSSIPTPRDECKVQALLAEARYFQLADLEAQCISAWQHYLVVTFLSHSGEALVNSVHIDGPAPEIKRLRTLLNGVLSPEHFTYMLDGTVLVVDLDGGHSGVEIAAHGLGGWNHGNSLIRELQACGWELRDQSIMGIGLPSDEETTSAPKNSGGDVSANVVDFFGGGGGNKLGSGGGRKSGGKGRGGKGGARDVGKKLNGCIVSRYIFRK